MQRTRPLGRASASLATVFTPAGNDASNSYEITLRNNGSEPLRNFRLCLSGPCRIDGNATIEGATVESQISNHMVLTPPGGFELAPDASWIVTARNLRHALQHWSDGATSAYIAFADGTTRPVANERTRRRNDNRPLLRGTARSVATVPAAPSVSIVPWPNHVAVAGARATPQGFAVEAQSPEAAQGLSAFGDLLSHLYPGWSLLRPPHEGGQTIQCRNNPSLAGEAYHVTFDAEAIAVEASSPTGFLYGFITLAQIIRGSKEEPERFLFPLTGGIHDEPQYGFRGLMLDVARQFYATGEVQQLLRVMAWNKLNRFHWHLSDDEAWRVEIDAYPELTRVGAWRGHGLAIPPLLGSGPEVYGGYYSKAAIREIVALASSLGISVIPEIDIPGHSFATLQSLPWLRDPDEHGRYASVQVFPNNCLNPVWPRTYEFLGKVIDELAELFPARIIHIGADEVPLGAWSGSPLALKHLEEKVGAEKARQHAGLLNQMTNLHGADEIEGSGAAILQAEFLKRVFDMLKERGCKVAGWEEAAHGEVADKAETYLVGWRRREISRQLAAAGYDVVVAPGQHYYLDMSQANEWIEPGAWWAGHSSPRETYDYEPSAGWSEEERRHLIGVQGCIWSEHMTDRAVFDRLVFPRVSAIAEAGWSKPESKSWQRFAASAALMPNLYGHWES